MRIEFIRALPGPNIYIHRPVLTARVELEELAEKESTDFPGFADRLLARLPGLADHHCAKGAPGGFVERLRGGTYFGHIAEHVALELSHHAGAGAHFGKTVYAGAPGRYDVITEYKNEAAARLLLQISVELVQALLAGRDYPLEEKVAQARRLVDDTQLGPTTRAIVDAAERRGIPWYRLNEASLVQLGYGAKRRLIQAAETSQTSAIGVEVACDKALTKRLLDAASIPVPRGLVVRSREDAVKALDELRPPLAVKPLDGNQGRGVSLKLSEPGQVAAAFDLACEVSGDVVVEEYLEGRDYRLVVVGGKLVAASERVPAHVVGDGEHTVAQLVEIENRNPLRGEGHEKPLTKIRLDPAQLERLNWSPDDVPMRGQRVFLRETANLSTGGTARDVTDAVHPEVARLCERAARVVGLDVCGVDLIAPDVSKPLPESGAGIVEVNAAPGIRMHHHPSEGRPRNVGAAIVDMLYPPGETGRVPTVAITGTNGKTTVTRMIGHAIQETGRVVGLTTTDGIYINGHMVAHGDLTGFNSCRAVLSDPAVEVAVLETARGGIVRRSLGYDWTDVGVLTNVQPDHLGQDGIDTVDDLLFIKSLVAERVRAGGTLVLNADDGRLASLPQERRVAKLPRKVVYFSLADDNPVVRRHVALGGTAFFLSEGWLVEAEGRQERRVVPAADIPVTLGGAAKFQVANALAALAACRAMGVTREQAASALASFQSGRDNHGRMNLYRVRRGYVVVDYGHNPGAFEAMCELTAAWPDRCTTGIFTAPGDRPDELVREVGRLAARCFDRLIIREDEDLRGRRPGEIAELLHRTVRDEAPGKDCRVVLAECEALRTALQRMEEGEVIVLFYEKQTEPCLDVLQKFGGVPANAIEPQQMPQHA